MKNLWILAAAATFAACASNTEDDMGAAPDRGDTTYTAEVDTTTGTWTDTTGAVGQPADTAVYPTTPSDTAMTPPITPPADTGMTPTVPSETYPTTPSDTGVGEYPSDPTVTPDTSTMQDPSSDTGMSDDSVRVDHSPDGYQGDSALTEHNVPRTDPTQDAQ